MYSSDLKTRDKSGALAAVIAIHAALAFAVLHRWSDVIVEAGNSAIQIFDVEEIPPPAPDVPKPAKQEQKPKAEEGSESQKNITSKATPVVAPKPAVALPIPVPLNAVQTPSQGAASTQGASNVAGPGTGAGGTGLGTGSGGSGRGTGGGGASLAVTRARLAVPPLRGRDFPPQLLDAWPRGATIWMRVRVDPNGAVIQCIVDRGTGNPAFDSQICAIVQRRLRYYPGVNESSQRVADWAGYRQEPPR